MQPNQGPWGPGYAQPGASAYPQMSGQDPKKHGGLDGYGQQQYPPQPTQFGYGYAQPAPYPPQGPVGYPPQQQPANYGYQQPPPAAGGIQPPGQGSASLGGSYVVNVDPDTATSMQFAETAVRNGFVRKVFGIVSIQLLITVGFACVCLFVPDVKLYVRTNSWPFWTAWGLAIALLLVLACVEKARRVWPGNMILLMAFTVVQAFLVGMISAYYNIEAVMLAFGVTAGEEPQLRV
eukprot:GHUV01022122.1.p1 GENE.GHUV01022122.1~~GHUV01022122.1.p1  ORF type:complete len:235 (+),score=45.96 GHUV01022122.1:139-843(+)